MSGTSVKRDFYITVCSNDISNIGYGPILNLNSNSVFLNTMPQNIRLLGSWRVAVIQYSFSLDTTKTYDISSLGQPIYIQTDFVEPVIAGSTTVDQVFTHYISEGDIHVLPPDQVTTYPRVYVNVTGSLQYYPVSVQSLNKINIAFIDPLRNDTYAKFNTTIPTWITFHFVKL